MAWLRVPDAVPHEALWRLGAPPARSRLAVGAKVEVLALPPSLADATWSRALLGRVGTVTEVHDYEQSGFADAGRA